MTVLDWVSLNPWLAFFLSWPTFLLLICWAWSFTSLVTTVFNLGLGILDRFINGIVILIRGYPPVSTRESLLGNLLDQTNPDDSGLNSVDSANREPNER